MKRGGVRRRRQHGSTTPCNQRACLFAVEGNFPGDNHGPEILSLFTTAPRPHRRRASPSSIGPGVQPRKTGICAFETGFQSSTPVVMVHRGSPQQGAGCTPRSFVRQGTGYPSTVLRISLGHHCWTSDPLLAINLDRNTRRASQTHNCPAKAQMSCQDVEKTSGSYSSRVRARRVHEHEEVCK